jgi:hemoglobin-like flavoprotein
MPEQVFVSYSRADSREKDWAGIFRDSFGGGQYEKEFRLWIDNRIEAGEKWDTEIEKAIRRSRIALLLVGKGFIESDYISKQELPEILKRSARGRMTIIWVPIHAVPNAQLETAGLKPIQAAWPLGETPLSDRDENGRRKAMMDIGESLLLKFRLLRTTSKELLDDLRPKIEDAIDDETTDVGHPFAAGDYSIFYKAKRENDEFVIKALRPSPARPWLSGDFVRRAKTVSKIADSTAIGIRNVFSNPDVTCVTMDFVEHPTLATYLKKDGKLESKLVINVLFWLVRLAGNVHDLKGQPIIGPSRPSHVHCNITQPKPRPLISLLPIVNETLATCLANPTWLQDAETLPYLSPERYYGERIDWRTDQYYLGLLALELLQGKPPVPIKQFADLKDLADFFDSPRSSFSEDLRLGQPAFSFVLAQMLDRNPAKRWPSMADLLDAMHDLVAGETPKAVKQHADHQYFDKLQGDAEFYRILLGKSPDIPALFRSQDIDKQAQTLNNAMVRILSFDKSMRTQRLEGEINRHRRLAIKPEHFGLFRDAFVEALSEAGFTDGRSHDAWRAVLDPALNYMRDEIAKSPS